MPLVASIVEPHRRRFAGVAWATGDILAEGATRAVPVVFNVALHHSLSWGANRIYIYVVVTVFDSELLLGGHLYAYKVSILSMQKWVRIVN